jgi:glycosyltransferase involved in cell wall biosynthesis
LRAATMKVPFVVARFVSAEFRQQLTTVLREFQPEVVQIESPFLLPYVETVRRNSTAHVVLRSLNVEFRIWEELGRTEPRAVRAFALRRVARSLRRYEMQTLNTCDALVPISEEDASDFRALGCTVPIHVAPCGVPLPDGADAEPTPGTVGFLGALDYRPNQQAVLWLVEELWPRVLEGMPEAKLSIAGSAPPPWLRDRVGAVTVPDAGAFLRSQSVLLAPLLSGGGMRIKVLEAMAMGKPVVATSRGAGGVAIESGRDILIADEPQTFAEAVTRLLGDGALRRSIGEAARAKVASRYDPDVIGKDVLRFYERLIGDSAESTMRATTNHARP